MQRRRKIKSAEEIYTYLYVFNYGLSGQGRGCFADKGCGQARREGEKVPVIARLDRLFLGKLRKGISVFGAGGLYVAVPAAILNAEIMGEPR